MTVNQAQPDVVAEALAERVIQDIYDRGLVAGDRYLTGDEACDTFHVGKSLLNNAFKLLADRQYLIRKRKAGTYIGPSFPLGTEDQAGAPAGVLDIVHVLMPMDYYRANLIPGGVFVEQIVRAIQDTSVQLHHIADSDLHRYTTDLIQRCKSDPGTRHGMILLRSPRESQRAVQDSGLPAVVFGSPYPGITGLCSIDIDQFAAGRLAAQTALSLGHDRFAMIMRSLWRHGDNLLMDGCARALGEAGVGVDRLSIVSAPEDPHIIEHEVAALLAQNPHPTALICRSGYHAKAACQGVRDIGLTPGRDVSVISITRGSVSDEDAMITIESKVSAADQLAQVAQALAAMAAGQDAQAFTRRMEMTVAGSAVSTRRSGAGRRSSRVMRSTSIQ